MKISRRSVLRYSGLTAALLALTGCSASPGSAILGGDLPDWMKSLFCGSAASSSASSEAAASSAASAGEAAAGEAAASSAASSEAASSAFSLLPAYDADPLTGEANRSSGRIVGVTIGGADSQIMLGHVFFDEPFSRRMAQIIRDEWDLPVTRDKLWENLFIDHIDELHMVARPYPAEMIHEFDALDDLREFDPTFIENVDSLAFDNIVSALGCEKADIRDVYPLKQGLTNLSCHVRVGDGEYVYRHPGVGTENLIDRDAELAGLNIARELGLDNTFITGDPKTGWKLSHFVPDCTQLDPHESGQTRRAMEMARALHEADATLERSFDFYAESKRYEALLRERCGVIDVPGFEDMAARMERLHDFAMTDETYTCLCHNDFFHLNFLVGKDDSISLIDWEYAGMSDYANDFGTYTVCCELSTEEAEEALSFYFGRTPTFEELRHNFAYVAFAGWCWYVWSLMKEAEGDVVGEWLYIYYRYAKRYLNMVLPWYEQGRRV